VFRKPRNHIGSGVPIAAVFHPELAGIRARVRTDHIYSKVGVLVRVSNQLLNPATVVVRLFIRVGYYRIHAIGFHTGGTHRPLLLRRGLVAGGVLVFVISHFCRHGLSFLGILPLRGSIRFSFQVCCLFFSGLPRPTSALAFSATLRSA
jgi:hypothetical protein